MHSLDVAQVHAVIAVNPHKTYVVSAARRQELLRLMLNEVGLGGDNGGGVCEAVCSGYVWVYGKQVGAKVLCPAPQYSSDPPDG